VDLKDQRKRKVMAGAFSQPLTLAVEQALAQRQQVILFQNRRGFSPFLVCGNCGHVPRCNQCDISLTFHKARNQLKCHYCGYTEYDTSKCPTCGAHDYRQPGLGTEKIEEEVKASWPKARVARMDYDTTRTRQAFHNLIRGIENHELDVLVGTQMVSKGLDFGNVTLVGVMDADSMLHFSDFRANEHTYQLLTQVSGRAGRGQAKGKVVLQSYDPDHPVLQLLQQDFRLFYEQEVQFRQVLHYPPFTRLIQLELRHKDQLFLEQEVISFRKLLVEAFGNSFLGPEYPPVNRLRGYYRMVGMLKLARSANAKEVRENLQSVLDKYYSAAPEKTLRVIVDVDPV
jgi:primosomal protein N' (replication factor Y)